MYRVLLGGLPLHHKLHLRVFMNNLYVCLHSCIVHMAIVQSTIVHQLIHQYSDSSPVRQKASRSITVYVD